MQQNLLKEINIILVEDNKDDIYLIELALKSLETKSNLFPFNTGSLALQYLKDLINDKKELPDLIMLDVNLPKITGLDILKKIKQNKIVGKIPIVVFTSSDSASDMEYCYENGADLYLLKPNNINDFKEVINQAIKLVC